MELEEAESKYRHILQPIRDLAENWNIDIATELEEYLTSLDHLSVTFDGGKTSLKFAEAALLIQGSTCIYSRKVEYLYSLVFEALSLFHTRQSSIGSSLAADGSDADASFSQRAPGFLPLDDAIEEGKKINLSSSDSLSFSDRRHPWESSLGSVGFLMAPNRVSASSRESGSFQYFSLPPDALHSLGRCSITTKGALVMEELLSSSLGSSLSLAEFRSSAIHRPPPATSDAPLSESVGADGLDAFDPPEAGHDSDTDLPAMDTLISPRKSLRVRPLRSPFRDRQNSLGAPMVASLPPESSDPEQSVLSFPPIDLFPLLDPFESRVHLLKPFKKGQRGRAQETEKDQLAHSLLLSEFSRCSTRALLRPSPLYHKELKFLLRRRRSPLDTAAELPSSSTATEAAPPAETTPRRSSIARRSSAFLSSPRAPGGQEAPAPTSSTAADNKEVPVGSFSLQQSELQMAPLPELFEGSDFSDNDSWDAESIPTNAALFPSLVPNSYEDMVHQHLASYLEGSQKYLLESQLSQRVSEWTQQIEPKLESEESRVGFDIHRYSSETSFSLQSHKELVSDFPSILRSSEPYEICRTFLAILQMANDGSIELETGEVEAAPSISLSHSLSRSVENPASLDGSFQIRLLLSGAFGEKSPGPRIRRKKRHRRESLGSESEDAVEE